MALADTQVNKVASTVNSKLALVQGWTNQARQVALQAINSVGTFEPPNISLSVPSAPAIDTPENPALNEPSNTVISNNPSAVSFTPTNQVNLITPPDIPSPVYGTPIEPSPLPDGVIAAPPTDYPNVAIPDVPSQPALVQPTAPTITMPSKPSFVPINIPDFEFPEIKAFDGVIPEYVEPSLLVNPQVKLVEYDPAALKARIDALSQDIMPTDLEEAFRRMQEDMVGAIDKEVNAKIDAAFTEYAALNYSIIPGMLIDKVNTIQSEGAVKVREGQAKLNEQIFKTTFENWKQAIVQGLALEKHLIDLHVEHARQLLEAEKLRVKAAIELFNATVAMHNYNQNARAAYAQAYKAELTAALRITESYKPLIDGAVAEVAENEAKTRVFSAEIRGQLADAEVYKTKASALTAEIENYKSYLTGIKAQADIIAANIEAYRDAVKAYAAGVDATSAELSAYAAQVQAASSGAGVYEANARAYASYVQEASKRSGAYKTYVSAQGDVLRANLQAFQAASNTNESFVRAQAAKFAAQAELASTYSSAFGNKIRAYSSYNKALAAHNAAMQTYAMVAAENAARAQALAATAQAETDKINAGAAAAKAQAESGLAQGAMSAMHVSASAQGSGSTNTSANVSTGLSTSWGGSTSLSESKQQILSA